MGRETGEVQGFEAAQSYPENDLVKNERITKFDVRQMKGKSRV